MMLSLDNLPHALKVFHASTHFALSLTSMLSPAAAIGLVMFSRLDLILSLFLETDFPKKRWKLCWPNELNTELVKNERKSVSEIDCTKPKNNSLLAL